MKDDEYIRSTVPTGESVEKQQEVDDDSEYFRSLQKNTFRRSGVHRVVYKERVYVDDYSDIPDGASLQEGPQGGLYYETEEAEEFAEEQRERTESILQEYDFSQEQINEAEALQEEYDARSDEVFGNVMSTAIESGAELTGGTYRVKGVGSMLRKAHVRDNDYDSVDELNDVFGCMVKPESAEGINSTAEALKEEYGEDNIIKEEDYMEEPQGGYYRARHLVVETDDGLKAEIQIKEPKLSDVASIGHALVYKNEEAAGGEDDVPLLDDETQEDVRDCLNQLSGVLVGEQSDDPDCTEEATSLINDMADKVQVA